MFHTMTTSFLLSIIFCQLAHSNAYNGDFYRKLSNRLPGTCQLYNGTVCREYLNGKQIYLKGGKSIHHLEIKLSRWFKQNKKNGQISRECWPHAEALTCMHFFPECNSARNGPIKTSVCSTHCSFLKQHICKGEYKRAKHSEYFQQYIPLCEEISLIDDSNGDFCFFLPTINMKKGPIPFAEPRKVFRFSEGKISHLKCSFGIKNFIWSNDNTHLITEGTWYKNNKRIVGSKRIIARTKQKGKARFLPAGYVTMSYCRQLNPSKINIRDVTRRDQGDYRCVITFANITVSGYAKLIVTFPRVIPIVKQLQGTCTQYNAGICLPYFDTGLGNNWVLEDNVNDIDLVNKQLEEFIKKLRSSKRLSDRCAEFGQAVLCYNKFKTCDNKTKQVHQSLCKKDCELFATDYCRKELKLIMHEKTIMALYIPRCDILRENNPQCIAISSDVDVSLIKNSVHSKFSEMHCFDEDSTSNYLGSVSMTRSGKLCDLWKTHEGYESILHDYCRNFHDNRPWCFVDKRKEYCSIKPCQPTCYKRKGEDYYGKVSVSKTGQKCLPWNKVSSKYIYSNIDHSFCRNFDDDQESPWCYVDKNVKELCDIPKCVQPGKNKHATISLVVYIVPAIVGATALMFSLFLLAFYMKNKKLLKVRKSKELIISESDNIDIPMVSTLSTTASLEFNKEHMDVERINFVRTPSPVQEISTTCKNRKSSNVPEVKEARLQNMTKIGDGRLGQLWQGEFVESRSKRIPVVIRQLRPNTRSIVISEFRLEMNMLRSLKHRNLQRIVCISAMSEIPFIAFECKDKIDLKEHLKGNDHGLDFLTKALYQISSGLEYMHSHRVLHKDIAARNCFLTPNSNIRISKSELGMCRYPDDYKEISTLGWSPIRWLSPEIFGTREFRSFTDVYMFGVLIWELFSKGQRPYEEYTDEDTINFIMGGNKLQRPQNCPAEIWNLSEQCWITTVCHRPNMNWIREELAIKTPLLLRHSNKNNNNNNNSCNSNDRTINT